MRSSGKTLLVFSMLLIIGQAGVLPGQEQQKEAGDDDETRPLLRLTDPRIVALTEAYEENLRDLRQRYVADVEAIGMTEIPPTLESVAETTGLWKYRGSWGGFANHSISINVRDLEATESWHHLLESPPLTPRDAIAVADSAIRDWYKDSPNISFKLKRLSLVPLAPAEGKWYWEAAYTVSRESRKNDLTIAFRMDGKVLTTLKSGPSSK